ncbi:F-box protein [Salix suchowensis]|nr:F-box protein [Salix suchowensis]
MPKIFSVADVGSPNECVELGGGPFGYRTRLLGSCNGLLYVCQSDMEDSVQYKRSGKYYVSPKIALWNPLTKKSHILPLAPIQVTSWSPLYGILDSLKANSWREIVAPSYLHYIVSRESVLIRESFHWLPIQGHGLNIVAFDIRREEYCTVPLPNLESKSSPRYRNLGVLGQCLSLASSSFHNVEIWVMKEYGMKDSWVRLLLLEQSSSLCYRSGPYDLIPLAFVRDDNDDHKVLLKWMYDRSLIWYDLKLKTYENVQIHGAPWLYQSYIFVGSLVSPLPPIMQ